MCGFVGSVAIGPVPTDLAPLQRASAAITHRGPDDVGYMSWSAEFGCQLAAAIESLRPGAVVVAHRRLSILDLSEAGRQPMQTADGRFAIAFNGEIYNFLELRESLERTGVRFHTGTDTEVLLQGLIQQGVDFLPKLSGMFAFAFFDFDRRTVLFARDFAGIKPLYIYRGERQVSFGSEMRSLLPLLPQPVKGNTRLVLDYLIHGWIEHSDESIVDGVGQLCAGSWLELSLDSLAVTGQATFWQLPTDTLDISFEEAVATTRQLFEKNITLHMRSDVPVAATLSGGIDSSAIVCMMRRLNGPQAEIHTFSYVADDESINEERWSDAVAAAAQTIQHKVRLTPSAFLDDLDRLIADNDLPLGNFNGYIGWNLFRATRAAGIKVSLDGQGADEILCGYDQYTNLRLQALTAQGKLGRAFHLYWSSGPPRSRAKALLGFGRYLVRARSLTERAVPLSQCPAWLKSDVFAQYPGPAPRCFAAPAGLMKRRLAEDFSVSSLPRLLRCFDRQAMSHSVENRVPFLTPELVEFLFRLPDEYLIDSLGERKKVFRHAIRGLVPDTVLDRKRKVGALTPNWLYQLREPIGERLTPDRLQHVSLWNPEDVAASWRNLSVSPQGDYRAMWRVLNLAEWARTFGVNV